MELLAKGRKLTDRYTLIHSLHSGDHTDVWLAHDDALKSEVVLKVCLNEDPVGVNLLNNEMELCSLCIHPGVVRTFELHKDEQHSYLSLEYLSGGSLNGLMGRSEVQFLPAMIQLSEALHYVHRQGIVHRDVKLDNCLFDGRGHARLIDFAIASVQGDKGLRSGGSPRSMSPQQRSGQAPEASDDIYSFGIALYRLAENQWPTMSQNTGAIDFQSQGSLPALIRQLTMVDSAARPESMQVVAHRLGGILAEQSNATLPPDEFVFVAQDDTHIDVLPIGANTEIAAERSSQPAVVQPSAQGRGKRTLFLLSVYGVLGALALFYFIPRMASNESVEAQSNSNQPMSNVPGQQQRSTVGSSAPVIAKNIEPWKLAQQAKVRKEAEAMLEQLLTTQFYLEDKQVKLWALDEFEKLAGHAIAGDQQFRQDKFSQALEEYQQGKVIADQLSQRAENIMSDTLAEAASALAAADSAGAFEKYTLAQAIEPESAAARTGLKRAANIDQVLSLVALAEKLEQQGKSTQALDAYRQANKLDGEWQAASKGIQRITRAQASRAYSSHMSAGFAALEQGDNAEAHSAFERAKRLRPNASEVAEAFMQLETAVRIKNVNQFESRAQELENSGDLRGAEREYQAALQADNSSQANRDAIRRVRGQAEVDEELTALLNDPVRLANDSVYQNAQELVQRAKAYTHDASITSRVGELQQLMQAARVPVRVTFVSDGTTDVLLYRVGRLGTFSQEVRALRPGEYSVVGTRAGYRDVRVKFSLAPGDSTARIEVICDEQI